MNVFETRLSTACRRVEEISGEVLDWICTNPQLVGLERISLLHEFHQSDAAARRLTDAVAARPAVGVAGTPKSGKSMVAASLIEPDAARVPMRFDGLAEPIDYLKLVVPERSRRGPSMAVRLTAEPQKGQHKLPISVRLLELTDVIIILGSAFLTMSAERARIIAPSVIEEAIARANSAPQATNTVPLSEEEVWAIRSYFVAQFGHEPLVQMLTAGGFWMALASRAQVLTKEGRADLLSPLWGGLEAFSQAFEMLSGILESLGGGVEARCALDAVLAVDHRTGRLTRRPDSILNGDSIQRLDGSEDNGVIVSNEAGTWVSVNRSGLSALCAELRLPVVSVDSELLAASDIIDFPGVMAREPVSGLARALSKDQGLLPAVFLKAKTAYLMERAIRAHELTGLVLCVDPAVRKVGDLASLVTQWVDASHGTEPAMRENQDNGLFLAFTKIDREFGERGRRPIDRRRELPEVIGNVLRDELGRNALWPTEWTPGRAFDNVHLLRAPSIKARHLIDYAADGRPVSLKSGNAERIDRARQMFLASDVVQRHVADPISIWQELMLLEDGGYSYLGQSLLRVVNGDAKKRQLVGALSDLKSAMKRRLTRYHVSDNEPYQRDQRRTAAVAALRRLKGTIEADLFGRLLRSLQLADTDVTRILAAVPIADEEPRINGQAETPEAQRALKQRSSDLAGAAIDNWIEHMRIVAADSTVGRRYALPASTIVLLVDELIISAARIDLEKKLAASIEQATRHDYKRQHVLAKAAACASNSIGDFIMYLGYDDVRSNSHPRRRGRSRDPIFPPREAVELDAVEDVKTQLKRFQLDWCEAFQSLVEENAERLAEQTPDSEQNARLGRLLAQLELSL